MRGGAVAACPTQRGGAIRTGHENRIPRLLALALSLLTATLLFGLVSGHALATHVQCGDVITQDTTLDSDLVDCPGDGIVIGADGITLDLNGHTVDGDGDAGGPFRCGTGVVNGQPFGCAPDRSERGHDGVTIKDGVVRQFSGGVHIERADGNAVLRLRIYQSTGAIAAVELSNSRIEGNRALDNGGGIGLDKPAAGNTVAHNVVGRNRHDGIDVADSRDGIRLERNTVFENSGDGIHVSGFTGGLLSGNRVYANGQDGMDVSDGVFENVIERNRVWDNRVAGIWMGEGAHRNRVQANTVFRNALAPSAQLMFNPGGITLFGGRDNLMLDNRVIGNGGLGGMVLADNTRRNLLEGNHVAANRADGILLIAFEEDNRVEENRATRNAADGIRVGPHFGDPRDPPRNLLLRANRADRNGDDGIGVESPQTIVTSNVANRNFDLGIEAVAGVTDGGGNMAFGNGDPLECVNVVCRTPGRAR